MGEMESQMQTFVWCHAQLSRPKVKEHIDLDFGNKFLTHVPKPSARRARYSDGVYQPGRSTFRLSDVLAALVSKGSGRLPLNFPRIISEHANHILPLFPLEDREVHRHLSAFPRKQRLARQGRALLF